VNGDFRVGPWLVKPGLNHISQNGSSVRVEPKVMGVLVCLASQPGEPVSKETILKSVWPDTFVSDDVLIRSVSELRRVFEDDAREPRFIETIPKRGYRLVAAVGPANGMAPPAVSAGLQEAHSRTASRTPWTATIAIATIILGLGSVLALNVGGLRDRWLTRNPRPAIRSLAVLPLQSLSADPSQEYFAEGMTDALITDLAQISALKVVSRTTTIRYGHPDKPLPQIARELSVDGIVEGTVQRSGDRVRITAQLIYGPADQHLWANSFERDVKDMLDLQNALASEIAGQIRVKVTPEEQAKLKSLRPVNPKALDAYLEARFHLDQAGKLDFYKDKELGVPEEIKNAISYLDRAIQEDPNYLPAYVAYFDTVDTGNISRLEFLAKAKSALNKALDLDESNIQAHLLRARLMEQYDYDWPGAERELKRALELSPSSADAHDAYAQYLLCMGRQQEFMKETELAQALDPGHDHFADAGVSRVGQTLEQDRQALDEKAPNDPFALGVMAKEYAIAGRFKESVEMYERCLTLYGWHDFTNVMKRADAKGGPRFALEEWMRASEAYSKTHDELPVFALAFTYASLGNKDRAFAWLDKAVEQRNWCILYLKADKVWDPLRSDPRFSALLRRVGLPQ
jgi:TolB-like protein/DNA-binding winged helix-turn-helix (wHTH) protein